MGEIINFGGKEIKYKPKKEQKTDNFISLLPQLRTLKDEVVIISINEEVENNEMLLKSVIKEVITLKCMGVITIIVANSNSKIEEYFNENQGVKKLFEQNIFTNSTGLTDVLEVIVKHDSVNKISNEIKQYNVISMALSGNDMNIILSDDVLNNNVENLTFTRKSINSFQKPEKKYSIDTLNELLKTEIIPIVIPTFQDNNKNEYIMESKMFAMYLAKYLNALKYVLIYSDNKSIPTACIYGVERFTKIIKQNNFDTKTLSIFNSAIEAVKNGVQGAHIIDVNQTSLLEELCNCDAGGLFLYDDTLNQL